MERVLYRPIIHLSIDTLDEQPIIGFVKELKLGQMVVEDYVGGRRVFVPDQGTVVFTQQRYEALFLLDPTVLLSFYYRRSGEIPFTDKYRWNSLHVADRLHSNGFWTAYKQYQDRKDEQPTEEI